MKKFWVFSADVSTETYGSPPGSTRRLQMTTFFGGPCSHGYCSDPVCALLTRLKS